MSKALLVPLDGLPLAEAALPLAGLFARTLSTDLELLRVSAPTWQASGYLERVAEPLRAGGLRVSCHVETGPPAAAIVEHAAQAAMVVMTTHARSGLRRVVLGSVAEHVVAQARAPTLLLRGGVRAPRLQTILLTISSLAAAPLSSVAQLAHAGGARVVLLRMISPEETYMWQWHRGPLLDEPEVVMTARRDLNDLVEVLHRAGIDAEARVRVGDVVHGIARVATEVDADLIVMATHARLGVERAVGGSVSDGVLHATMRPVLLCRLVPMPPQKTADLEVLHALQRREPRLVPQSIGETELQYRNIGLPRTSRTRGR